MLIDTCYEAELQRLDKDRKEALSRMDAPLYTVLCQDGGVYPEDVTLYNQGVEVLRTEYIDINKDPIWRMKYKLNSGEVAGLSKTDIRRYRPNLHKRIA
ncbi:MAG: hypothetical protein WC781_01885 [Candidatus Pacearchaeota archaeon]|jgi:hypothetical protein